MKKWVIWGLMAFLPAVAAAQPITPELLRVCPTIPDWGAPNRVQATPVSDGLRITWIAAAEAPTDIAAFEIARAGDPAGSFSIIGLENGTVNEFIDRTAVAGTIYFYRVRAIAQFNCTPWSDAARGLK